MFGTVRHGQSGPRTVSAAAANCRSPLKPAKLIAAKRGAGSPSDKENDTSYVSSGSKACIQLVHNDAPQCEPVAGNGESTDAAVTHSAAAGDIPSLPAPAQAEADSSLQAELCNSSCAVSSPSKHESIHLSPLPAPHAQPQAEATPVLLQVEGEGGDDSTASALVPVKLCMGEEEEPLLLYPDLDASAIAARVRQEGEVLHARAQQLQEEATQACRVQGQSETTPAHSPSTSLIGPPPGTPPPYASPMSPLQALRARIREARDGAAALAAEIQLAQDEARARLSSPYSSPLPPSPKAAPTALPLPPPEQVEEGEGEDSGTGRRFSLDSLSFHEAATTLPALAAVREALGSLLHSAGPTPPLDASAISHIAQQQEEEGEEVLVHGEVVEGDSTDSSEDDLPSLPSRGRAGSRDITPLARAAARAQSWGSSSRSSSRASSRGTGSGGGREGRVSPAPVQVVGGSRAPSPAPATSAAGKPPLLPTTHTHASSPGPLAADTQVQGVSIATLVVQAAAAAAAAAVATLSSRPGTPISRRDSLSLVEACTQTCEGGRLKGGVEDGKGAVQEEEEEEPAAPQAVSSQAPLAASILFSSPMSLKKLPARATHTPLSPMPMPMATPGHAGVPEKAEEEDGVLDAIMTGSLALPTSPAEEAASALKASRRLARMPGGSPTTATTPLLDATQGTGGIPWSPVSPPSVGYRGRGRTPASPSTHVDAEATWLARVQQGEGEGEQSAVQQQAGAGESRGMLSGLSAYTETVPGGGPMWWLGDEDEEEAESILPKRTRPLHAASATAAVPTRPYPAWAPSADRRARGGGARPWLPAGAYKHKDAHGLLTSIPAPIGSVPSLSLKAAQAQGQGYGRPLAGRSTR